MKKQILVGYDDSNASQDVLSQAKMHAQAYNAEVHIVTGDDDYLTVIRTVYRA